MNTINNQGEVTRLTLKKTIFKNSNLNPNSCGEINNNSFGKDLLCLKGFRSALDTIIEDLEVIASGETFNGFSHNHQLIMLIEEVCYNLITDVVRGEGAVSLECIYEHCLQEEGRRITKIYLDDEFYLDDELAIQESHTVLPISEIMTLRESVTSPVAKFKTNINHHRQLFIYLYLARQKLLVTNN